MDAVYGVNFSFYHCGDYLMHMRRSERTTGILVAPRFRSHGSALRLPSRLQFHQDGQWHEHPVVFRPYYGDETEKVVYFDGAAFRSVALNEESGELYNRAVEAGLTSGDLPHANMAANSLTGLEELVE